MIAANESSRPREVFESKKGQEFFMKKHFKFRRLGSFVLAAMMALCLCVPALAAEGASRITYDVFQIFTGQYADSESGSQGAGDLKGETLSNVKWGKNGTGTEGQAVDKDILIELDVLVSKTPDGNATNQGEQNMDSYNRDRLAVITKYVNLESEPLHKAVAGIDEVKALTLDNGYYLVRVTPGSVSDGEAYPTYTVQVLNNHIDFKPKGLDGGVPDVTKKTGDGTKSKSDAAVGDVVTFVVTSTLPTNLHDYYEYYWTITDTMSEGLTWAAAKGVEAGKAAGVVSCKIDDTDVTDQLYVGEKAADGKILMGFQNILAITTGDDNIAVAHDGSKVVITYQAIVNSTAKIASDQNTNDVKVTYSHDPNHSGDGSTPNDPDTPPAPKPNNPTGGTVEGENSRTQTWLTGLTVEHFNAKGTSLTGSTFELTGDNIKTIIKYTSAFESDPDGLYYKLKGDKGYTSAEPIAEGDGKNDDLYDLTAGKFTKKDVLDVTNETPTEVTAVIDENGQLSIGGLKSGTYKLQNTKIPNGYNLAEDIDFVISFDETNLFSSDNALVEERTPEWFYITLVAGNGTLLPETGGAGVYFLYGGGIALLIAAVAVVVIRNKKKSAEK